MLFKSFSFPSERLPDSNSQHSTRTTARLGRITALQWDPSVIRRDLTASPAPATQDTVEMDTLAQVFRSSRSFFFFFFSPLFHFPFSSFFPSKPSTIAQLERPMTVPLLAPLAPTLDLAPTPAPATLDTAEMGRVALPLITVLLARPTTVPLLDQLVPTLDPAPTTALATQDTLDQEPPAPVW